MAYARWGEESDVYVFADTSGGYCCCGCNLRWDKSFYCDTPEEMVSHLLNHRLVGHKVPDRAIERLGTAKHGEV